MATTRFKIIAENVSSVYSGKAGACCCGCKGKHSYASTHREWAEIHRGYPIDDDEVSDRSVALICSKIMTSESKVTFESDHVYTEVGNRIYIAYFKR